MSKSRKIASWILIGLTGAHTVFSAIGKLTAGRDAMITQNFIKWELEGKLTLIDTQELLIALLFLIPKTSRQTSSYYRRTKRSCQIRTPLDRV